jgi:hypothetical protein
MNFTEFLSHIDNYEYIQSLYDTLRINVIGFVIKTDGKLLNVALVPTVIVLTLFPEESNIVYVNVPVGDPVLTKMFIDPLLPQFELVEVIDETANPLGVINDTD